MALQCFFPDDIARVLASHVLAAQHFEAVEYRSGYVDAIRHLATAFGATFTVPLPIDDVHNGNCANHSPQGTGTTALP